MVLALDDRWIWDAWYARAEGLWHAFFLQAPKALGDPELRHWNVSVGHAVSRDLRDWTHLGTCLAPAGGPAWDDFTTWTGSVVAGPDGLWHLFYTGTCRAEDGLWQRIGHAVSDDLHVWRRVGEAPCLDLLGPVARHYEAAHRAGHWHDRAMRDPWVMRDPGGGGWLMHFTARTAGAAEANAGGAIGLATSPDLWTWRLQPPVFSGDFGQFEVPQVFSAAGRWYCLFCTAAEHWSAARAARPGGAVTGTHYLVGDGPRGPWRVAGGAFLDGALPGRRYAGRVLETEAGLSFLGFADRGADGGFLGHVTDPDPVEIDAAGRLAIRRG